MNTPIALAYNPDVAGHFFDKESKAAIHKCQPLWWTSEYLADSNTEPVEVELSNLGQPAIDLPDAVNAAWFQEELLREICRRKLQAMDEAELIQLLETTKV